MIIRQGCLGLPMEALCEFHLAVWIRADQTYQMSIAKFEELAEQKLLRRQQKAAIWIQARQGGRAAGRQGRRAAGPQGGRAAGPHFLALYGFVHFVHVPGGVANGFAGHCARCSWIFATPFFHVFPCLSVCLIVLNPFVRFI